VSTDAITTLSTQRFITRVDIHHNYCKELVLLLMEFPYFAGCTILSIVSKKDCDS